MIGGIISGAAGALGGIFGGIGKNRSLKKQIKAIQGQQAENQDWFDRRYNEDATQRADAQRLLTMTMERMRKRKKSAESTAAVMGVDPTKLYDPDEGIKAYAEVAGQIAAAGEARKDAIEGQYMERKNGLQNQINNLEAQKQSALDIASGAIGGATAGFGKGLGWDVSLNKLKKS